MPRGVLERRGNRVVRLVDRGGQLPGTRLRILEQLRKPSVHLGASERICRLVRAGGKERVGEVDTIAVELHDASLERRRKTDVAVDSGRGLGDREGGVRMRRSCEEEVAAVRR